jgi:hypothetical protein
MAGAAYAGTPALAGKKIAERRRRARTRKKPRDGEE